MQPKSVCFVFFGGNRISSRSWQAQPPPPILHRETYKGGVARLRVPQQPIPQLELAPRLPAQCPPLHSSRGQGGDAAPPDPGLTAPPPPLAALQPSFKMASGGWMKVVAKRERSWNNMTFRNMNQLALSVFSSAPIPPTPTPTRLSLQAAGTAGVDIQSGSGARGGATTWRSR